MKTHTVEQQDDLHDPDQQCYESRIGHFVLKIPRNCCASNLLNATATQGRAKATTRPPTR